MNKLNVWDFKRCGTPEYVLVKAGLLMVSPADEGEIVAPGPALSKLFQDQKVPPIENITPAMTSLVIAHALEKSDFIDTGTMRVQAVSTLREQGMTAAGISSLGPLIDKTAALVKQELAGKKQMYL
jgi:hypothetical protein